MRQAIFREADLSGATFANADVWGAKFDKARNIGPSLQEALVAPFVAQERR